MTNLQKITTFTGCIGIVLHCLGLTLSLNYVSIFLGRLSALFFAICIGGLKPYFFIPITLAGINSVARAEELIFLEM